MERDELHGRHRIAKLCDMRQLAARARAAAAQRTGEIGSAGRRAIDVPDILSPEFARSRRASHGRCGRVRRGVLFRCEGPGSFDESHPVPTCVWKGARHRAPPRDRQPMLGSGTGHEHGPSRPARRGGRGAVHQSERGLRLRSHGGQLSPYAEISRPTCR